MRFVIILVLLGALGAGGYYAYENFLKPAGPPTEEVVDPAASPTPPPVDPAIAALEAAGATLAGGDRETARHEFIAIVEKYPNSPKVFDAIDAIGRINVELFFSPTAGEGKTQYTVASGDTLNRIASRNNTTSEMIMRINGMDTTVIRIGDVLTLASHDFTLKILLEPKTIDVYNHGKFFKRYRAISVNMPGTSPGTEMTTKVNEKIAWRNGQRVAFGSKEFADATRWIMLGRSGWQIFSHTEPSEGQAPDVARPSTGIELTPEEVDELHAILTNGTEVIIQ